MTVKTYDISKRMHMYEYPITLFVILFRKNLLRANSQWLGTLSYIIYISDYHNANTFVLFNALAAIGIGWMDKILHCRDENICAIHGITEEGLLVMVQRNSAGKALMQ